MLIFNIKGNAALRLHLIRLLRRHLPLKGKAFRLEENK